LLYPTGQGNELSPDVLSSGEQHELVMFYEFLFKVPKDSLLLIDEPELSLHIDWQQKFLKDLIEIADLAGFDVIIATHAPSIINNYWSLAVDLGELGK
jgi:predicted ATP-binding protein involved in virulence